MLVPNTHWTNDCSVVARSVTPKVIKIWIETLPVGVLNYVNYKCLKTGIQKIDNYILFSQIQSQLIFGPWGLYTQSVPVNANTSISDSPHWCIQKYGSHKCNILFENRCHYANLW